MLAHRIVLVLSVAPVVAAAQTVPTVIPRAGLVITSSVRLTPGTYRLPAPTSLDAAVITVQGDDITVDFTGVTLLGLDAATDPDLAQGIAVRIDGGKHVRLHHGTIRGYTIAILARGTRGLTIDSSDVSHNWKPRLFSLVEHESLVDWLSFHHNEKDEWLRFGAGIYLADVRGGSVRANRGVQGMNGLLLVRSDSLEIADNEFSFNSGLGIGLYRSSDNVIVRNRLDYNVRGFSQGFYRRGQDSADLLLYEQSLHNIVAFNSATHGGDGLFLWAGQTTMDSGKGGANDNVFYRNDFSYAPANGMEATFSRNAFVGNRVLGNDYGLWGGYSYELVVAGNCFGGNRVGVAIEHGQDNRILGNRFDGDTTAISLWGDPIAPSDWGYPKFRDTRSRDYSIVNNRMMGSRVGLRGARTTGLKHSGNQFIAVDSTFALRDTTRLEQQEAAPAVVAPTSASCDGPLPDGLRSLVPEPPRVPAEMPLVPVARLDRSAIVVDEWGPFDYRSPKLWPLDSVRSSVLRLRVLGPEGAWHLVDRKGVGQVSKDRGRMGDTLSVTPAAGSVGGWEVTLEYLGGATVSPRGVLRRAGEPVRFSYGRFEPTQDWEVRFFAWADSTDPRLHADAFAALLRGTPLLARHAARLDYEWYRPTIAELPRERWALEAVATVTLPRGDYTLRAISDDAVRVWVDGVLAVDHWTPHESAVDHAPLSGGRHELRVLYYQADGWTELRLDILRGLSRSAGSPGPH
jgi:parallel beta-helix repeat protein